MRRITMELSGVIKILGGEKVLGRNIRNRMDLIELCNEGLSKEALVHLARNLSMSTHQMAELLPVTEKTIESYPLRKQLSRVVSEQIIQIAQTAAKGTEVFGNKEKFLAWLNCPNSALPDKTPLSLLPIRNRNGAGRAWTD